MIGEEKAANAVGGRTARACESCLRRRARWYCAADDAFLCGGCDASVHSANQLAQRHERVRLGTPSSEKPNGRFSPSISDDDSLTVPAWHRGFTRKARTPRKKCPGAITKLRSPGDLVPELSGEFFDASMDESDDGSHCRVPVFEPFLEMDGCDLIGVGSGGACDDALDIGLLLPPEVAFDDFVADVESLLGKAAADEGEVKVKDEIMGEDINISTILQIDDDVAATVDWDLDFRLPSAAVVGGGEAVEEGKPAVLAASSDEIIEENNKNVVINNEEKRTKMLLRLNYEDIITAWASHGSSPWADGTRPEFSSDWPESMGLYQHGYGSDTTGIRGHPFGGVDDKGREARVSRYREKRRTRMFSKKIRYQVRKLNAEKRPRMKGRFVKRS